MSVSVLFALKNNLCAVKWTNYIADLIVLIVAVGFAIYCGKRGFIDCFFSFVSTTIALFAGILLAKAFLELTNGFFGLDDVLQEMFTNGFSKLEGFTADVSAVGMDKALEDKNIPAVIARLALKWAGKGDSVPEGTTLAFVLGHITSQLFCFILMSVLLFVVCKLLLLLLKGILNRFLEEVSFLDTLNIVLGVLVGVSGVLLVVCAILAFLAIIPAPAIGTYMNNALILKVLYNHNPLVFLLGLLI